MKRPDLRLASWSIFLARVTAGPGRPSDLADISIYVGNQVVSHPGLENQRKTAQAFIGGYNEWDVDGILDYRTPDCQHQVLPYSMNRAAKNNDEYRDYMAQIMPLFTNFTVTVHKEVHDPIAHVCSMHASSSAQTEIGQYANEYALFLTFTEDGKKISRIEEFADSAYSAEFFSKLDIRT